MSDELGTTKRKLMGRPRRGARPRAEVILDAALSAFIKHGVNATTMGEVAATAGTSKTTLYKLFPDLDRLFAAVLEREVTRRRTAIATAHQDVDLDDALRGTAHAMLDALDKDAVEIFRLVIAEAGRRPKIARDFYASLVSSAARPVANRLTTERGISSLDAHALALQFFGAVKEPLFYPKLMETTPEIKRNEVINRAVMMLHAAIANGADQGS